MFFVLVVCRLSRRFWSVVAGLVIAKLQHSRNNMQVNVVYTITTKNSAAKMRSDHLQIAHFVFISLNSLKLTLQFAIGIVFYWLFEQMQKSTWEERTHLTRIRRKKMIKKKRRQLTKEVNLSFMHFADRLRLVRSFSRFNFNFLINWQPFNLLLNALLFNFELLTPFCDD